MYVECGTKRALAAAEEERAWWSGEKCGTGSAADSLAALLELLDCNCS